MSYKPILFNTEMVKAIKVGRKTQTRRVCKGQGDCNPVQVGYHPPFKPGDILWVRETWQHVFTFDDNDQPVDGTDRYIYYADNHMPFDYWVDVNTGEHKEKMNWKPSIHMPKEAARIFLRVQDVRVERLREISASDAMDEGFAGWNEFATLWNTTIKPADLDVYGWNADPWVWVIEFERCEKPEGFR